MKSPDRRRIMMDLYETDITQDVLEKLLQHIENLRPRIVKVAFAANRATLKNIQRAIKKEKSLRSVCCYFSTDMEEGKTWLVSDEG